MTTHSALIATGLTRKFGDRPVVLNADLCLEAGKITALIGESGSGKTTLLRLLAGMERPDGGEIQLGEQVLSGGGKHVPVEDRRIGLVFQDFALFPHLTVLGNVMFGLRKMTKPDRRAKAEVWIEKLGLTHRIQAYPHQLSGGEQQRTAIARALAPEPLAILLDEPFSGLDPAMREQVRDIALAAVHDAKIPALLVTHDANEALMHADKIAVMHAGSILQTGSPDELYRRPENPIVAKALGPVHRVARNALPSIWSEALGSTSDFFCYRPEAVQLDPSGDVALLLLRTRLAGPVTELTLQLENGETIYAACQPGAPLKPGASVKVSLNPDLVFAFQST